LFAKNVVLRPAVGTDTAIQKKIYFSLLKFTLNGKLC